MYRDLRPVREGRFWLVCILWVAMSLEGLLGGQSAQAAKTWDGGFGSADAACRAKIGETGGFYVYSRVEIKGDVGHCYVKAKDGTGEDIYDTAVTRDDPPEPEQPSEVEQPSNEAADKKNAGVPDSGEEDGAQDVLLSKKQVKAFEKIAEDDVHAAKGGKSASKRDLYKKPNGDIVVKPKGGKGPGEPTGFNMKDLK